MKDGRRLQNEVFRNINMKIASPMLQVDIV